MKRMRPHHLVYTAVAAGAILACLLAAGLGSKIDKYVSRPPSCASVAASADTLYDAQAPLAKACHIKFVNRTNVNELVNGEGGWLSQPSSGMTSQDDLSSMVVVQSSNMKYLNAGDHGEAVIWNASVSSHYDLDAHTALVQKHSGHLTITFFSSTCPPPSGVLVGAFQSYMGKWKGAIPYTVQDSSYCHA